VTGCCECGDEPLGSGTTELVPGRNSETQLFLFLEQLNMFYEPAANGLGMLKALIFGVNSGRFISTSVCVSCSQFSIAIAIKQSSCEVLHKENTVNSESY
jgi:hypothetical protein